jgi:hypothetical protein
MTGQRVLQDRVLKKLGDRAWVRLTGPPDLRQGGYLYQFGYPSVQPDEHDRR